jgi:hypothetical protein
MRTETITKEIYSFEELSSEAKEKAIENIREDYYKYNDFAEWAIDDCALFEPKHKELEKLFSENYKFPLIENNRKNIYFDIDRNSYLDCKEAMVITNDKQFLLWLGIDTNIEGLKDIYYSIYTPSYRNANTKIDFDDYSSDFDDIILEAQDKFNDHIEDILKRIEADIDYRYTDEAIIEDIITNDYEFEQNGLRWFKMLKK